MTTPNTAQAPVVFEGRGPRISLGYNPTVDYIRFLAALVIVQFHARAPLNVIGQGAVGFFILAMIWFTLNGLQRRKEPVGAASRCGAGDCSTHSSSGVSCRSLQRSHNP
ncbi:hypothetical protein CDV49_17370 [Haematobacter genomosp. 1]|uniref:Uncharacterized protein n=1 Tax=Haematobacter genomosp. 1 TaxID=366618 RepID=A0A212A795_9RHOB|nr:hypothetical protein CDV49_17370 [Haematobacter genomosp. 1]